MSHTHFLFDIDNTLTQYREHALEHLLFGNFLFPTIAEYAVSSGMNRDRVESVIHNVMEEKTEWDYPDFSEALQIPFYEILPALREWHKQNLNVYTDSVRMIHVLLNSGIPVSIISNNPLTGCLLKLERCGLADAESQTSVFHRILSTEIMHGCKGASGSWKYALESLNETPECRIFMVGDDPKEDGVIPLSLGISEAYLLNRHGKIAQSPSNQAFVFENADAILSQLSWIGRSVK